MNALKSFKSLALAAALVLGAATPAVFAQPMMGPGGHGGPGMHQRGPGGHGGFDGQRLMHMLDDIGASEAQITQIRTIFRTAREELRAQAGQGQGLHLQMLQLWAQPNIDAAALDALRKQQLAQHERVSARMQAAFVEAGRVLTPEQRAKMLDLAKKRMDRMQRRANRGG
ncbi:Spy/CpxP family protein refolding chaperone [Inhella sp.]|uniref:Spy/CpxP family protein refolding chaperone n=1 Tax=Inhella sp. TaxID=1921806 RepID=UPI0035B099F4